MECLTRFLHLRITICLCTCFSGPFRDVLKGSVPQIDVAPTLSMLLGLPIPTTNMGKMIPALLHNIPVSQQLYALYYNCKQVATQFENQISSSATQGDLKLFYKFRHLKLCVNYNCTYCFTSVCLSYKRLFIFCLSIYLAVSSFVCLLIYFLIYYLLICLFIYLFIYLFS